MKTVSLATALVLCLSLNGCATPHEGTWELGGGCKGLPDKPVCEIDGKIGGKWGDGGDKQDIATLAHHVLLASGVADAAQFAIDVSGSTIVYPASGVATLTLRNSATGTIRATRDFGWTRSGTLLKLSNPDGVNSWALANGGDSNELSYRIKPFPMNSPLGPNVIALKSTYEGIVTAASVSSYYRCTSYPSRHQCMQ